ncbi:MAG: hypothetical protein H0X51_06865 [Parachlamydiaceae bacterium]|nr:hypothetical protein [Parachlamydiaceae bacterium]
MRSRDVLFVVPFRPFRPFQTSRCPTLLAPYDLDATRPTGRCQLLQWVGQILRILINRIIAVRLRCLPAEDVVKKFPQMSSQTLYYFNNAQWSALKDLVVVNSNGNPTSTGQTLLNIYQSMHKRDISKYGKDEYQPVDQEMCNKFLSHLGDSQKTLLTKRHSGNFYAILDEAFKRAPRKASEYTPDLFTQIDTALHLYPYRDSVVAQWSPEQQTAYFQKLSQVKRIKALRSYVQAGAPKKDLDAFKGYYGRLVATIVSAPAEAETKSREASEMQNAKIELLKAFGSAINTQSSEIDYHLDPQWLRDMATARILSCEQLLQITKSGLPYVSERRDAQAPFYAAIFEAWGKSIQENEPAATVLKQYDSPDFRDLSQLYDDWDFPFTNGREQHTNIDVERGQAYLLGSVVEAAQALFEKDPTCLPRGQSDRYDLFTAVSKSFKSEDYAKIEWTKDLIYHLDPKARKHAFAALSDERLASILVWLYLGSYMDHQIAVDGFTAFLARYKQPGQSGRDIASLNRIVERLRKTLPDSKTVREKATWGEKTTPGLVEILEECRQLTALPIAESKSSS